MRCTIGIRTLMFLSFRSGEKGRFQEEKRSDFVLCSHGTYGLGRGRAVDVSNVDGGYSDDDANAILFLR